MQGGRWCALVVAVLTAGDFSSAHAAAEAHYAGSSARLTGHLVMEKRTLNEVEGSFPILHLENSISLLRRSQYPGDGPETEGTDILLRGPIDFPNFATCTEIAAIGILDFQRVEELPDLEMQVQHVECRDDGRSAGTVVPDPPSANERQDLYACEPGSSVWLVRKWSPYSDMDPDLWKAADLLIRDDMGARWPSDLLRSLAIRLSDARARLVSTFPEADGEWDFEYVPRMIDVGLTPELQARLDAFEVGDNRIRKLPDPVDTGLEKLCTDVCGCTVILEPNPDGSLSIGFSPTTNLLYALRKLRELPDVRSARLVKSQADVGPSKPVRKVLRARTLPSAFHFTLESTDAVSGQQAKRFFVVNDDSAREVSAQEAASMLSFDPPALPADAWQ